MVTLELTSEEAEKLRQVLQSYLSDLRMEIAGTDDRWHPGGMAPETTEVLVQLATRIPKSLHRELKLHCFHTDTSVMEFVVTALREKLARQGRGGRRTRDEGTS